MPDSDSKTAATKDRRRKPRKKRRRIAEVQVDELSLVDDPAVPEAHWVVAKRRSDAEQQDGGEDMAKAVDEVAQGQDEASAEAKSEPLSIAKARMAVGQAFARAVGTLREVAKEMEPHCLYKLADLMEYSGRMYGDVPEMASEMRKCAGVEGDDTELTLSVVEKAVATFRPGESEDFGSVGKDDLDDLDDFDISKIEKGKKLASLLRRLVDRSEGDNSRTVARMGRAAGIEPDTVNNILGGSIDCPPRRRLAGFARVLGTSEKRLVDAAEMDGCSYSSKGMDESGDLVEEFTGDCGCGSAEPPVAKRQESLAEKVAREWRERQERARDNRLEAALSKAAESAQRTEQRMAAIEQKLLEKTGKVSTST